MATRLPIILAHGIARFDVLKNIFFTQLKAAGLPVNDDDLQYFRGIKRFLTQQHFSVFTTDVAFAAGVDTRAKQLSAQILAILQTTGESQVHVVAHSMGGLDARHMIVDVPGMVDKVASLTTIGTPHNGTVFADRGLNFGG